MRKSFLKVLLVACSVQLAAGTISSSVLFAEDKIAAIVNSDAISQKEVNDFLNYMRIKLSEESQGKELENRMQSIKLDILDRLIEDRLLVQQAEKKQIQVDPQRVKGRLNEMRKRYRTDSEFQEALMKQGLTISDVEKRIKEEFLKYFVIDIEIRKKVVVSPSEVTKFYNESSEEFTLPSMREFALVSTDDSILAYEFYNRCKKGSSFTRVAEGYSLPTNKISVSSSEELKKEMGDAAFSLSEGEVSAPIKIGEVYYLVTLEKISPSRKLPISELQDKIHTFLFEKKMQESLASWLEDLKKTAYIKIIRD